MNKLSFQLKKKVCKIYECNNEVDTKYTKFCDKHLCIIKYPHICYNHRFSEDVETCEYHTCKYPGCKNYTETIETINTLGSNLPHQNNVNNFMITNYCNMHTQLYSNTISPQTVNYLNYCLIASIVGAAAYSFLFIKNIKN